MRSRIAGRRRACIGVAAGCGGDDDGDRAADHRGTAGGGVGPMLAGAGLTEQEIRDQVINGGGAMPAGLAQGQDLDNVVAYVLSIQ